MAAHAAGTAGASSGDQGAAHAASQQLTSLRAFPATFHDGSVSTACLPECLVSRRIGGNAGVSAVPASARVSQVIGQKYDPTNYLLMHAMAPNVAGVVGSAVAAGVLLGILGS